MVYIMLISEQYEIWIKSNPCHQMTLHISFLYAHQFHSSSETKNNLFKSKYLEYNYVKKKGE